MRNKAKIYITFLLCFLYVINTTYSKDFPFAFDLKNSVISESGFHANLLFKTETNFHHGYGIGLRSNRKFLMLSLFNYNAKVNWSRPFLDNNIINNDEHGHGDNFNGHLHNFKSQCGVVNYNLNNLFDEEINIAYFNYMYYCNPFYSKQTQVKGLHLIPSVTLNSAIKNINLGEANYESLGKQALNSYWGFEGGLSAELRGYHTSYLHWELEADASIFLAKSNIIFFNFNYELFLHLTYLFNKQTQLNLEDFSVSLGANYQWAELKENKNEIYSLYLRLYYHFPYEIHGFF